VTLTEDQKAMLRLLAQREEGYEDMAALMGISVEEVRARVKEALAEVDEDEAPVSPPPPPPASPRPSRPALKLPKPKLPIPKIPGGSQNRGALIGIGAGLATALIFVIVLIVAGGGSSSSTTSTVEPGRSEIAAAENGQLTEAILSPTSGGNGSGRALFGRYKKNVLLQVEASGLEPSPPGENYTVWLFRSPKLVLRIGAVPVGKAGKIAVQFPIPTRVLAYVANGAFNEIDVSLTSESAYKAELTKAKKEKRLPAYTGQSVLRGEITGPAIKKQ
jgi:hypothetical protein